MAVLQFFPHDGEAHGYAPPILDLHERPLIPARLVPPDHKDCQRVFQPGELITVHEIDDRHFLEWARCSRDFKVVNASPHPEAELWRR